MKALFCPSCGHEFEQNRQATACPKCKKNLAAKRETSKNSVESEEFEHQYAESLLRTFDSTLAAKRQMRDRTDSTQTTDSAEIKSLTDAKDANPAAAPANDLTSAAEFSSTFDMPSLVDGKTPDSAASRDKVPETDLGNGVEQNERETISAESAVSSQNSEAASAAAAARRSAAFRDNDALNSRQQAAATKTQNAADIGSDPDVYRTQKTIDAGSANATVSTLHEMPKRLLGTQGSATIADYQLEAELGKGSFGTVWRARQIALNRNVAIKLLHGGTESGNVDDQIDEEEQNLICAEFLREAQFNGRLDHPNIVPIHELGIGENGKPFYAMKEIRGISWRDVIRDKSLNENLEIFDRVAEAIGFAHSRNILHCDLKPENVMLGEFGEVLVVDWGQAIDLSDSKTLRAGGSPVYLAPEMASYFLDVIAGDYDSANSKLICKATDTYVLGAILFEIITGAPPHPFSRGDSAIDVVHRAADNEIRDYSEFAEDELMQIALRALGVDGRHRYECVAELQHDLDQYESRQRSIEARVRAEHDLAEAQTNECYDTFQKARFGFEEAVEYWPDNQLAHRGLREVKLKFAALALAKQDFDLGLGQLDEAESDDEAKLISQLRKGRAARNRAKKLVRLLLMLIFGVISAGIVICTVLINRAMQEQEKADIATKDAEAAKYTAVQETKKAMIAIKEAKQANIEAQQAKDDADLAEFKARKADREADEAERKKFDAEKLARAAEIEKKQAVHAKMDVDFRNSISNIDRQILAGEFELARKSLQDLDHKQGWEWGRLELLTHPEVQTISERVVAQSLSGNRETFAFASANRVQVRTVAGFQLDRELPLIGATAVALSHDASLLAIGVAGEIRFYGSSAEREEFPRLRAQSDRILHLEFSPSADRLLSVGEPDPAAKSDRVNGESDLMVWRRNAGDWTPVLFKSGDGKKMMSAHFSHDGRKIVTAGDKEIHVMAYDDANGAYVHYEQFPSPSASADSPVINAAMFATEAGDEVMCGCEDSLILLWRLQPTAPAEKRSAPRKSTEQFEKPGAGRTARSVAADAFPGHVRAVRSLDLIVSESGAKTMVSAGDDGNILLWNCRDKTFRQFPGGHATSVRFCGIAADRRTILSTASGLSDAGTNATKIRRFDSEKYRAEFRHLDAEVPGVFMAASQSISARHLAFVDEQGRVLAYSDPELSARPRAELTISRPWRRHFPAGGKLFSESSENKIYIWDIESGRLDQVWDQLPKFSQFDVSGDGAKLALLIPGSGEDRIEVWDVGTDKPPRPCLPVPPAAPLSSMAISPDGQWIVGGSVGVFVWSATNGELNYETPRNETDPQDPLDKIIFSEDPTQPGQSSKFIVGWNHKWLRLFDAADTSGKWLGDFEYSYKTIRDAIEIEGNHYVLVETAAGWEVIRLEAPGKISKISSYSGGAEASFSRFQPDTVLICKAEGRAQPILAWNWREGSEASWKLGDALAETLHPFSEEAIAQVRQLKDGTILVEGQGSLISLSDRLNALNLRVVAKPDCLYAAYINDDELVTLHGKPDARIRFWKLSERQSSSSKNVEVTQFHELAGAYSLCQCSLDERFLFLLSDSGSNITIYDIRGQTVLVQEALVDKAPVQCVCWSTDSEQVFLGLASGQVICWEFAGDALQMPRQRIQHLQVGLDEQQAGIKSISLDADADTMLLVRDRGTAQVFHRIDGDEWIPARTWDESDAVVAGAISPDGTRAVTTAEAGVMTLWNISGGEKAADTASPEVNEGLLELYYHKSAVQFILFTPNGRSLITAESGVPGAVVWPTAAPSPSHPAANAQ